MYEMYQKRRQNWGKKHIHMNWKLTTIEDNTEDNWLTWFWSCPTKIKFHSEGATSIALNSRMAQRKCSPRLRIWCRYDSRRWLMNISLNQSMVSNKSPALHNSALTFNINWPIKISFDSKGKQTKSNNPNSKYETNTSPSTSKS